MPISQAEFAQLVAESMATSNGPHHHHPPNTDQDYEGPEHALRDSQQSQQNHHAHHGGGRGGGGGHSHAHHYGSHRGGHGGSQYQPEDNYRNHQEVDNEHEDNQQGYHRSPVYESSYHNDRDEEGDELDQQNVSPAYGGPRGSGSNYDNYDNSHQPESHQEQEQANEEESRLRPIEHYMPVATKQPASIVQLVHFPIF